MGWKASCILVNDREPGYLGTLPAHDAEATRRLIDDLGLGPARSKGMTSFDEGMYPRDLVIGAYDGAAVIGSPTVGEHCFTLGDDPLMRRVLDRFPEAEIARIGLHSVVNFWSYEFFDRGRLRRAYGGSADDGVLVDLGELLPEERPHFERSAMRDGERVFLVEVNGTTEEFDPSTYGEELVFDVMGRFFGANIARSTGEHDPFALVMEAFEPPRPRRWWWPFARA
ncbi:hypothetical protein AB1L88_13455 [Tautonia sp. JC769]|uniref:DUF6928 family protein n=1 Tax=Tautonia sp. JC769 TaxID=3232135 RepID=UPI003459E00F